MYFPWKFSKFVTLLQLTYSISPKVLINLRCMDPYAEKKWLIPNLRFPK